jgi:hypothetical protein
MAEPAVYKEYVIWHDIAHVGRFVSIVRNFGRPGSIIKARAGTYEYTYGMSISDEELLILTLGVETLYAVPLIHPSYINDATNTTQTAAERFNDAIKTVAVEYKGHDMVVNEAEFLHSFR